MSVFSRLREERQRLALTQSQVADHLEVHLKTVQRWEAETAIPADMLARAVSLGVDAQYVLTGVRSPNAQELSATTSIEAALLSGDEWDVVRRYRSLSDAGRIQARKMLEVIEIGATLVAPEGGIRFSVRGSNNVVAGRTITREKKRSPKK